MQEYQANGYNAEAAIEAVKGGFENITDVWVQLSNGMTVTPGYHFLDAKGNFRTISDILATDSQIVLADGTLAKVTGEYIHYSVETADMF